MRIEPSKGWVSLRLYELWEYRELLYFFIWRDIKVRYKQTVLGGAWAIIQPFFTMVVFSLFFGKLAKMPSDGIPYPIFSYAALVPWTFFANGLNQASNSLVGNSNLMKKVYFPRLSMPIASVLGGLIDFVLAFIMLVGMMFYYGMTPTVNMVWLPLFVMLAFCHLARSVFMAFRPVCPVSGCAPHHTFSNPDMDVCHTHCIPEQPARGAMAYPLWDQPDGRSGRGVPLGLVGNQDSAGATIIFSSW